MRLVSMMLISYNNSCYIYEALDSIFSQDYDNIEIVISDDGSQEFDLKKIKNYVQSNKRSNIKNVIYNVNDVNLGTCRHVEKIASFCNGDCVGLIAADDALYDCSVLSDVVSCFEAEPENDVVCCNLAMCDEFLKKEDSLFVSPKDIELINSGDKKGIYGKLAYQCLLPALGTFYNRNSFNYIFDNNLLAKYDIIEDWTSHIILIREGFRFAFLDRIAGKHRFGGVSHNDRRGYSESEIKYYRDIVNIFNYEVEPYKHLLGEADYNRAEQYLKSRLCMYEMAKNHAIRSQKLQKYQHRLEDIITEKTDADVIAIADHIIIAVKDEHALSYWLDNIFSNYSGDGVELIFAFAESHSNDPCWAEKIINEVNSYREKKDLPNISIYRNIHGCSPNEFIRDLGLRISSKCVIAAPSVLYSNARKSKEFINKQKNVDIDNQISQTIKAWEKEELKEKKQLSKVKTFVFDLFKYITNLELIAGYAAISGISLIFCAFLSVCDSLLFEKMLSKCLFVVSMLFLNAFVFGLIIKVIAIFVSFLKERKKVDYGREFVNNYITINSAIVLLFDSLVMFIAWKILNIGSIEIKINICEHINNLYLICALFLMILVFIILFVRIIYRTYKFVRYGD